MEIINHPENRQTTKTTMESKAFRYGEGFFTTTAVKNSVPVWLERHIQRLNDSMADFGMGKLHADELSAAVCSWIQKNHLEQGYIRIMTWNEAGQVKVYIQGGSLPEPAGQVYGIKMSQYFRHSSQVLLAYKSFNYWMNNLAYQEAVKQGYNEVVFLNEKEEVCEGSRGNIFWVYDNVIYTPDSSCGLLPGICREKVLGLANKLSLEVVAGGFNLNHLQKAQEVFLSNSVHGIRPVSHFESIQYPGPGLITGLMNRAYEKLVENHIHINKAICKPNQDNGFEI